MSRECDKCNRIAVRGISGRSTRRISSRIEATSLSGSISVLNSLLQGEPAAYRWAFKHRADYGALNNPADDPLARSVRDGRTGLLRLFCE